MQGYPARELDFLCPHRMWYTGSVQAGPWRPQPLQHSSSSPELAKRPPIEPRKIPAWSKDRCTPVLIGLNWTVPSLHHLFSHGTGNSSRKPRSIIRLCYPIGQLPRDIKISWYRLPWRNIISRNYIFFHTILSIFHFFYSCFA